MKIFTAYEYLLIDICNQFGLDKLLFEERIQWVKDHMDQLELLAPQANKKTRPLYLKAVMALRRAQAGKPIGHLVGLDGVASGIQIMSAITGCEAGARATGLIDPNRRADPYTEVTDVMNTKLHSDGIQVDVPRDAAKQALMTSFYGSRKTPKDIFGADTPELNAFYHAAFTVAPGAWELLQDLLASWQAYALVHSWKLPDGFDARVKVMTKKECRIEVDELDHATFTYEYYENEGSKSGLSNVANVVHSIDAFVLREMHRRCNYNAAQTMKAYGYITEELAFRKGDGPTFDVDVDVTSVPYYIEQWKRSGMVSSVIIPHLTANSVRLLTTTHLEQLRTLIDSIMVHKPFELVTIHDEFKCHPNHCNHLRAHYIDILAELADSHIVSDILSQIHGVPGTFTKLSANLSAKIRNSNYALS